jgi:hypothetical protein
LKDATDASALGYFTFANYSWFNDLILPEGIKSIETGAFSDCKAASIEIPLSLEYLGSDVFDNEGLKRVYIKDINAWCGIYFTNTSSNPLLTGAELYDAKTQMPISVATINKTDTIN